MMVRFLLLGALVLPLWAGFPWPLAPMNEQHRVSATFDECRADRDHFHSGTDIPLAQGGAALSIEAGQVTGFDPNGINSWIRVGRYAYVHTVPNPALNVGDFVNQGAIVGWTNDQNHIHLNDGGGASGYAYANSLRVGGISPFVDPYRPRSPVISLRLDGTATRFPTNQLSGRVDIWAQAADTTDLESTIDMNNGVYKIGWALYSADTSTLLEGPYYRFQADNLYSSAYINNVYAPGSNTSTYIYIVTNRYNANSYLDCDAYATGNYVIAVMSADTRNNWDTTYVAVEFTDTDWLAPEPPVLEFAGLDNSGQMTLKWNASAAPDLAGYKLYYSFDGASWNNNLGPETLTSEMTSYTFPGFPENSFIYLKMTAVDNAPIPNESGFTDTYGVKMNLPGPQILIVDGFDRTSGSWTANAQDFSTTYGSAISSAVGEVGIQSATNEWVQNSGDLSGYQAIIWFVGDDSRTAETFSGSEQTIIENYLSSGGNVFLSGSEIGYDLSAGNTGDLDFMHYWLGLDYAGDASGNYSLSGTLEPFAGFTATFGAQPYIDDWPDYFNPTGSGYPLLAYGNQLYAGIANTIIQNELTGRVLTVGFAWETMAPAAARLDFMTRLFQYFGGSTAVDDEKRQIPAGFTLSAAYPNPGNGRVGLLFATPLSGRFSFLVYDILGRMVYSRAMDLTPGQHLLNWDNADNFGHLVGSGMYLIRIKGAGKSFYGKVTLLK